MAYDFSQVTERGGEAATHGQIADMFHRYQWARGFCCERRVLEAACGTGQGLGILASVGKSVMGCDVDAAGTTAARATYGDRLFLCVANAEQLPVRDASFDVIVMFEAIYYLSSFDAFLRECRRVLAPAGLLLFSSTNKELLDFVPSAFSRTYYGADEIVRLLDGHGFFCKVFGYSRTDALPLRHRVLRPVKALAQRLGLLPRSMQGKALLRQMVFGRLPRMPHDLLELAPTPSFAPPTTIACHAPDRVHRFIYVVAARRQE